MGKNQIYNGNFSQDIDANYKKKWLTHREDERQNKRGTKRKICPMEQMTKHEINNREKPTVIK